ncbi:MAG: Ig domain-containing protein, partial [Planctomycetota bacterium]
MKIGRVIFSFCLVMASLLAVCQPAAVLAQDESLTIDTLNLPAGWVGTAYSETLEASDGAEPYTWSISEGSLPAGLTLDPATGEISGTPTGEETANFTVKVMDSATPAQEA